jgi:hypothetical protein
MLKLYSPLLFGLVAVIGNSAAYADDSGSCKQYAGDYRSLATGRLFAVSCDTHGGVYGAYSDRDNNYSIGLATISTDQKIQFHSGNWNFVLTKTSTSDDCYSANWGGSESDTVCRVLKPKCDYFSGVYRSTSTIRRFFLDCRRSDVLMGQYSDQPTGRDPYDAGRVFGYADGTLEFHSGNWNFVLKKDGGEGRCYDVSWNGSGPQDKVCKWERPDCKTLAGTYKSENTERSFRVACDDNGNLRGAYSDLNNSYEDGEVDFTITNDLQFHSGNWDFALRKNGKSDNCYDVSWNGSGTQDRVCRWERPNCSALEGIFKSESTNRTFTVSCDRAGGLVGFYQYLHDVSSDGKVSLSLQNDFRFHSGNWDFYLRRNGDQRRCYDVSWNGSGVQDRVCQWERPDCKTLERDLYSAEGRRSFRIKCNNDGGVSGTYSDESQTYDAGDAYLTLANNFMFHSGNWDFDLEKSGGSQECYDVSWNGSGVRDKVCPGPFPVPVRHEEPSANNGSGSSVEVSAPVPSAPVKMDSDSTIADLFFKRCIAWTKDGTSFFSRERSEGRKICSGHRDKFLRGEYTRKQLEAVLDNLQKSDISVVIRGK